MVDIPAPDRRFGEGDVDGVEHDEYRGRQEAEDAEQHRRREQVSRDRDGERGHRHEHEEGNEDQVFDVGGSGGRPERGFRRPCRAAFASAWVAVGPVSSMKQRMSTSLTAGSVQPARRTRPANVSAIPHRVDDSGGVDPREEVRKADEADRADDEEDRACEKAGAGHQLHEREHRQSLIPPAAPRSPYSKNFSTATVPTKLMSA